MIILSSSGGLFIVLKFTIYFIYKIRKLLRNAEEDESDVSENKNRLSRRLGKITKQLSTKDSKKRKRLVLKDLLQTPASV